MILPIVIANWQGELNPFFDLEIWKPPTATGINLSLIHRSKEFFQLATEEVKLFKPEFMKPSLPPDRVWLECGGYIPKLSRMDKIQIITSDTPDLVLGRFPDSWEAWFQKGIKARMAVEIPPFTQKVVGLKVALSDQAKIVNI